MERVEVGMSGLAGDRGRRGKRAVTLMPHDVGARMQLGSLLIRDGRHAAGASAPWRT